MLGLELIHVSKRGLWGKFTVWKHSIPTYWRMKNTVCYSQWNLKYLHVKQAVGTVATVLFDIPHNVSGQAPQKIREAWSTITHARLD